MSYDRLSYDPETGIVSWKEGRRAGYAVGSLNSAGYLQLKYDGCKYLVSRVIFTLMGTAIPEGMQVDHINGDRLDNRWKNLRLVSSQQNAWNRKAIGVHSYKGGWRARTSKDGKDYELKFNTKEEAVIARQAFNLVLFGEHRRSNSA